MGFVGNEKKHEVSAMLEIMFCWFQAKSAYLYSPEGLVVLVGNSDIKANSIANWN